MSSVAKLRDRFSLLSSLQVDITIIEPVDKMENVKILTTNNKAIVDRNMNIMHTLHIMNTKYHCRLNWSMLTVI